MLTVSEEPTMDTSSKVYVKVLLTSELFGDGTDPSASLSYPITYRDRADRAHFRSLDGRILAD